MIALRRFNVLSIEKVNSPPEVIATHNPAQHWPCEQSKEDHREASLV
jgi:hypothetical protein